MRGGIFQRGAIYYTNTWDPIAKKKIKERVGPDRNAALARAAQLRAKFLSPSRRQQTGTVPRLSEYIPVVIEEHYDRLVSRTNAVRSLRNLLDFAGDVKLTDVTKSVAENYKRKRLKDFRPHPFRTGDVDPARIAAWEARNTRTIATTTVNRELEVIKRMMNHAVENEILEHSPLASVKKFGDRETRGRRRTRCLFDHEARTLLAAAAESRSAQLHDLISLALYTGRRKGDLLNLKVSDVDKKNGLVQLLNTKLGEPEWIPVPAKAQAVLARLVDSATTVWLFPGRDGEDRLKGVDTAFKVAVRRARLVNFRFHDLRRTAISGMVMAGLDMLVIARLVGHTSVAMLDKHYGHLSPKHKAASTVIFGAYMDEMLVTPAAVTAVQSAVVARA